MKLKKALALLITMLCVSLPFEAVFAADTPSRAAVADGSAFTQEERAFIEASESQPVRVGLIGSVPPMCYTTEDNSEYDGVCPEMLRTVAERTGVRFEYVVMDLTENKPVDWLKSGSPDLVVGIVKTENFMSDGALLLSNKLIDDAIVAVARQGDDFTDDPAERTIAVPVGFQVAAEYVAEEFPEHNVIFCDGTKACLDAVAGKEADAMFCLQSNLNYMLQNPHYESLEIVHAFTHNVEPCMAARAADGGVLMSVVNKGLAMIGAEERSEMILKYTIMNPYQPTLGDVVYKYRTPLAVIAFLIIAVIAVLISRYSLKRKSTEELKAAYEQGKAALALAEKASAAKGSFMSRMSHEIRTPLNAVIGYNAIARSEMAGARTEAELRQANMKVMDSLTKSDIASKHLLTIINDVLDMSAIESGRIQVSKERFDFRNLISSLTVLFFTQAQAKKVGFDVVFDTPTEEWFVGDQMRINQVLTNLLSNAVKFTHSGGSVRLTISQRDADESTALMRFEVADTGIGMEPEYLAHIWTPFEQADSTISRRFGGTGLGLAITKSLVDLMGGTISVESQKNAGSAFTVELPLERTRQLEAAGAYNFESFHALVVDDDASTREYIKLLFDRFGVRCQTAASGEEALELIGAANASGDTFNLCLIDWRMNGLDGIETVRRLRQVVEEELPIIIVTAYDFSDISDEAEGAGVDMFASKPLFQSSLFDLLVNISGRRGSFAVDTSSEYDFAGSRLLLAEDNRMNMEVASKILTRAGFAVDAAWDGSQAVKMFCSSPKGTYDAILMDVQMPELDGYAATRAIRASEHPEAASIPIIAMTADAFAENVAEALESGMNGHIAKPIVVESLFDMLRKHIKE